MRSLLGVVALGLVSGVSVLVVLVAEEAQEMRRTMSGGLLAIVVAALAVYNLRGWVQRRPRLVAPWRRLHLWLAALSVVLFLLHTGPRLPDGILESVLYTAFAVAGISGAVGAYRMRRTLGAPVADSRPALWQLVHYPATDVVCVLAVMHTLLVLHSYGGAVR